MTMVETTYEHVLVDDAGVAWIEATTMKVIELVLERRAYGGTPEDLHAQHPSLTLGQIYSALSYYEDHKIMLDREIKQREELIHELRRTTPRPSVLDRLERQKRGSYEPR